MALKSNSEKSVPQNVAVAKPELKTSGVEDKNTLVSTENEASNLRDERILKFASSHNFLSKNSGSDEIQLEELYSALDDVESAIDEKNSNLFSSGKFSVSGIKIKLSGFQKTKIRNEIRNLKKSREILKKNISQIERNLTSSFQRDTFRIVRSNVRSSARKSSYHTRFGVSIKTAISKVISGLSGEELKALKTKVEQPDLKKGDAFIMQTLLKAPRHLLTKVAANPEARIQYLQYFRDELKAGKK